MILLNVTNNFKLLITNKKIIFLLSCTSKWEHFKKVFKMYLNIRAKYLYLLDVKSTKKLVI